MGGHDEDVRVPLLPWDVGEDGEGDGAGSPCFSSCLASARALAGVGGPPLARTGDQDWLGKASGETHLLPHTERPQDLPPRLAPTQSPASPGEQRRGPAGREMALSLQLQVCKNPARVKFFFQASSSFAVKNKQG